jgi:integrase
MPKGKPIPTVRATDAAIESKQLGSGPYIITESAKLGRIYGFMLICNEQSASFVLQKKLWQHGKKRTLRVKLGERGVDGMNVKEAHDKATAALALINEGKNPTEVWKAVPGRSRPDGKLTLQEVFERYIREGRIKSELRETTIARYTSHYKNHLAHWSECTMLELGSKREAIDKLHTDMTERNGWAVANATIQFLSFLYDRATDLEDGLLTNPCAKIHLNKQRVRNTALSKTDLRFWWSHVAKLHSPVKRAYWLTVALTGGRRTQIASSEWTEIDFEAQTWQFPDEHAKDGRGYKIPLSSFAVEFLTEWRTYVEQWRPGCRYVFPGKFRAGTHLKRPRNDKQGLPKGQQSHAMRHTWETAGASVGLNDIEAHLLLGHSLNSGNMRHRYTTAEKVDWQRLAEKQEEMTAFYLKALGISHESIREIILAKVKRGAWKSVQKTKKAELALVS